MKKYLPWFIVGVFGFWIATALRPPHSKGDLDIAAFGDLPVLLNGRIQPMNSVGMNSLLQIRGSRSVPLDGNNGKGQWGDLREIRGPGTGQLTERNWYQFGKHPRKLEATPWLMEVLMDPETANDRYIFAINHPDLVGDLELDGKGLERSGLRYFSFNELEPHLAVIEHHAQTANPKTELQTPFERAVVKLHRTLALYFRLKNSLQPQDTKDFAAELDRYLASIDSGIAAIRAREGGKEYDKEALSRFMTLATRYDVMRNAAYLLGVPPHPGTGSDPHPPPGHGADWKNVGQSLLDTLHDGKLDPAVAAYSRMSSAYVHHETARFNRAVADYTSYLQGALPSALAKGRHEHYFNHYAPFYKAIVLYLVAFILACLSWFNWSTWLNRSAYYLVLLAAVLHTSGLIFRMVLEGRPPVTNLYSSAIFVGWGAVVLGAVLERIYRDGIGSVIASLGGFITLIIAHNLSTSGDTMEMLRAVLDTNFWLATHVVVITLGYSSTFVAGGLAAIYILRGVFTRSLTRSTAKALNRMVYGVVCFATLFSFVGTILGGIWADQSWGRFWGWDPKENGALLIVIWNAIVLHVRWGGLVKEKGLMPFAVFGNIVTGFSWFGVNMLGVGLHSYGFMDAAFKWLVAFSLSQLAILGIGMLPDRYWLSRRGRQAASNPRKPQGPGRAIADPSVA